jgi:diaminopimelate decarboxylase
VDICGPLCTSIDVLARSAMLPELLPGDIIAIHSSGAYGPTASPLHFLSHRFPREVIIERLQDRVTIEAI